MRMKAVLPDDAWWQCHYVVSDHAGYFRPCAKPADSSRFCNTHWPQVKAAIDRERGRPDYSDITVLRARLEDALERARTPEPQVYYIRRGDELIKIGFSVRPLGRMAALGKKSDGLELLATEPGGQQVEYLRHQQFAGLRVVGEWFRPGPSLLRHIQGLQAVQQPLALRPGEPDSPGRSDSRRRA